MREPPTSPEQPDVQFSGKTPKQICLCVVEKLNMIFLVFFICYLSWSIPANYGLFTSGTSHFNVSTDYDSKKYKVRMEDIILYFLDGYILFRYIVSYEVFVYHSAQAQIEKNRDSTKAIVAQN